MIRYCKYPSWYLIWVGYVEPTLHLISSGCLLFLIAFNVFKKCKNVFRAMIVTMSFNLLCMYLGIVVAKFGGKELPTDMPKLCFITGIMIYFSYLSVMFWLNTLCFDVWSSFPSVSATKKLRVNVGRFEGFKDYRFKKYAIYGWGIPLLLTTFTLTIEFLPSEHSEKLILPGFASTRCFLESRLSVLFYQLIPTGMALILNLTLYVLFVWNLLCGNWANQSRQSLIR